MVFQKLFIYYCFFIVYYYFFQASIERECYPSPLGYYMFPKSCCTSVNEVICHGIPDMRPLQDGEIVNCKIFLHVFKDHMTTFIVLFFQWMLLYIIEVFTEI